MNSIKFILNFVNPDHAENFFLGVHFHKHFTTFCTIIFIFSTQKQSAVSQTYFFFLNKCTSIPHAFFTEYTPYSRFLKYPCVYNQSLIHVWLFVTTWTVACQAPLSMGFSRQDYWSGLPCPHPKDLPNLGIEPTSPILQADSLLTEPPGKL